MSSEADQFSHKETEQPGIIRNRITLSPPDCSSPGFISQDRLGRSIRYTESFLYELCHRPFAGGWRSSKDDPVFHIPKLSLVHKDRDSYARNR